MSIRELVKRAEAAYQAMSPEMKAWHDHEQKRSYIRGMCPSNMDFEKWRTVVDRLIPYREKPKS